MDKTPISLTEYWNRLDRHDWMYPYAEGPEYRWGSQENDALRTIARQGPDYSALYNAFAAHHFSGPAFGKPKAPKPHRPLPLFD